LCTVYFLADEGRQALDGIKILRRELIAIDLDGISIFKVCDQFENTRGVDDPLLQE